MQHYVEGKTFKNEDYSQIFFKSGVYEHCTFLACIFANVDITNSDFSDCIFEHCDLSMAVLKGVRFRETTFKSCKMLGLRFDECNPFLLAFNFESCLLNFSCFYKLKLKGTHFQHCKLQEVDFTETELTKAVFADCDLSKTTFFHTILEQADFSTAFGFSIDPENNRLQKATFSAQNIIGLLDKYQIKIV